MVWCVRKKSLVFVPWAFHGPRRSSSKMPKLRLTSSNSWHFLTMNFSCAWNPKCSICSQKTFYEIVHGLSLSALHYTGKLQAVIIQVGMEKNEWWRCNNWMCNHSIISQREIPWTSVNGKERFLFEIVLWRCSLALVDDAIKTWGVLVNSRKLV